MTCFNIRRSALVQADTFDTRPRTTKSTRVQITVESIAKWIDINVQNVRLNNGRRWGYLVIGTYIFEFA
jgi:hypothetical protein